MRTLHPYSSSLLPIIGVFSRFMVHLQSSSSPLFINLYAFIILFLAAYLLLYYTKRLIGPHQPSSGLFTLFMSYSLSFSLLICTSHPLPAYNILDLLALPPAIRRSFSILIYNGSSSILFCAFTLETTRKPERRGRWVTGAHSPFYYI
jgi:hypothetical protein